MIYFCAQKNRRTVTLSSALNGIDYLEAGANGVTITLAMLKPAPMPTVAQVFISGGETVTGIIVKTVAAVAGQPSLLLITVDRTGDFSRYTLSLRTAAGVQQTPAGIDPALSTITFGFHPAQDSAVDCATTLCCPPEPVTPPDINYLAKDYPGFQQVILDRMAVLAPGWTERHPADLGVALVDLLAYAVDHLSYRQDAVATEAYLGTARSRISLRRHARLVDYAVSDGANAMGFVQVAVSAAMTLPAGTPVLPLAAGTAAQLDPLDQRTVNLIANSPVVFATMAQANLMPEQNEINFHTWSDTACCLPAGATCATLKGTLSSLLPGAVLVFEEVCGPDTGAPDDADPTHRCAVRLASAWTTTDPLTLDPATNLPLGLTEITWDGTDALPFTLCISAPAATAAGLAVSVARGNMVPADHGVPVGAEQLGPVPAAPPTPVAADGGCQGAAPTAPPPFFFPSLAQSPLTFARAYDPTLPASLPDTGAAAATLTLIDDAGTVWNVFPDLLGAGENTPGVVIETENDGTAWLRFGDGTHGMAPQEGQSFTATYRSGNGGAANVGRDSLGHVVLGPVSSPPVIRQVRNPLAATGGVDGESMASIRQRAPFAFRTQLRAVTEANYADYARRDTRVADARASFRWTGSWRTAFVSIDPVTGAPSTLTASTQASLELARMAGTDVVVEGALLVGLTVSLQVTVLPGYQRKQIAAALQAVFSATARPDGTPGLLDPNGFTFGGSVYLSPFVAAAQSVEGVAAVRCTAFQRIDDPNTDFAQAGVIPLGRLEIARIDNDPDRPDLGGLTVDLEGGW
jgi:uncharacterized phage protein gp47/JayE